MNNLQLFHHIQINNNADRTLFLLHGTGGDEHDLLPLVEPVSKLYNFVSLRGNVSENGMNRFFKRYGMGNFDQDSIKEESEKFAQFITNWVEQNKNKVEDLTFLGYSNGANMILAQMFYHPELIRTAVLMHPMLPFEPDSKLDLSNHKIFISYGKFDQMISAEESQKVIELLKALGADVIAKNYDSGHEVTSEETEDIIGFLRSYNSAE